MLLLAWAASTGATEPPSTTPHDCRPPLRSAARPRVPNGTSVRAERYPIRIWYDPTHPHSVEILPLVLDTVQNAWDVQVTGLGFRQPVLPDAADGPEFDVYLVEYQPFAAYVSPDMPYEDAVAGDGHNSTSSYMVVDRRLPEQWVPSYLSHEFNHACQYATDFSEPTLPLWEGTATAAQEWSVGEAGRWEIDVPSFQEANRFPTLTGDSYTIWYDWGVGYTFEYGTAFWVRFLDQRHGDGTGTGGARLWEAASQEGHPNEPDAVDAFAATAGGSVGDALNAFALVRFLTGDDWDERGLAEAAAWGPRYAVPADPLDARSALGTHAASVGQPMITGQVFWDLDLAEPFPADPDGTAPALIVEAPSARGDATGLMVATWRVDGGTADQAVVGAGDGADAPRLRVPLDGVERVVVAVTHLGPEGWDGDQDAYVDGDQVLRLSLEPFPPVDAARGTLVGGGGCDGSGRGVPGGGLAPAIAVLIRWGQRGRGGSSPTNRRS